MTRDKINIRREKRKRKKKVNDATTDRSSINTPPWQEYNTKIIPMAQVKTTFIVQWKAHVLPRHDDLPPYASACITHTINSFLIVHDFFWK